MAVKNKDGIKNQITKNINNIHDNFINRITRQKIKET